MSDLRDTALRALDETFEAAQTGPVPKSRHLSFILKFLAAFADDDAPFVLFWREATNPPVGDIPAHQYGRRQSLSNAYKVIYRSLGLKPPE